MNRGEGKIAPPRFLIRYYDMSVNFPEVIDDAFRQYQPTLELLNNLRARKANPQEFVILV
jgi:hypothetical protein